MAGTPHSVVSQAGGIPKKKGQRLRVTGGDRGRDPQLPSELPFHPTNRRLSHDSCRGQSVASVWQSLFGNPSPYPSDERRPGGNTVCRCLDVSFGEPKLCLR